MATNVSGYLPNDRPEAGRLVLLGLQHVVTMFPATVLVALLCGFHPSTVLLGAGVSTIVALVPLEARHREVHPALLRLELQLHRRVSRHRAGGGAQGAVRGAGPGQGDRAHAGGHHLHRVPQRHRRPPDQARRQGEARPGAAACHHRLGRVRDRHRPREGRARHVAHRRARLLGHRAHHAGRDDRVLVPAPGPGLHRHAADPARRDRRVRADPRRRARPDQLRPGGRGAARRHAAPDGAELLGPAAA